MSNAAHNNGSGAKRPASAKQQAGRDESGRFAKGNPGGPGNPFARKVAALRKALISFVTDDDIKEITLILMERAKMGDTAAVKLLFQYALGKPGAATDPDRVDIDEWQLTREKSRPPEEMAGVIGGMPANLASEMTRIAWPCAVQTNFKGAIQEQIAALDYRDAPASQGKKAGQARDGLPADIVDRLALGGLGAEGGSVLGMENAPSANGGNGSRSRRDERARNGKRR